MNARKRTSADLKNAMETGMSTGTGAKRAKAPILDETAVQDVQPDATPSQELHDRIEQRAYQLYEERGGEPGHEVEDWLQAERELLGKEMDTDLG
jgi:hypothetical protein